MFCPGPGEYLSAEAGKFVGHGDAIAACEDSLPFLKTAAVFPGNGLVGFVHHYCEQMDDGGEFTGVELTDRLVGSGFERGVDGISGLPYFPFA